jgi:hypothetical protein
LVDAVDEIEPPTTSFVVAKGPSVTTGESPGRTTSLVSDGWRASPATC